MHGSLYVVAFDVCVTVYKTKKKQQKKVNIKKL